MSAIKRRGGRPSREEAPRRTEHLLDIATENFVRLGYSAATLDRISAEAGVAKRTIYSRFPDKQALFFAVIKRLGERRILEDLPEDDSFPLKDGLRRRARLMIDRALAPEELTITRMMLVELHNFPDLGKILWKTVEDEHGARLMGYFRKQQQKGAIRAVDPAFLSQMFLFSIFGFTNQVALRQTDMPKMGEIDAYVDRLADVLVHGAEK